MSESQAELARVCGVRAFTKELALYTHTNSIAQVSTCSPEQQQAAADAGSKGQTAFLREMSACLADSAGKQTEEVCVCVCVCVCV
jgi:hypothetical protein